MTQYFLCSKKTLRLLIVQRDNKPSRIDLPEFKILVNSGKIKMYCQSKLTYYCCIGQTVACTKRIKIKEHVYNWPFTVAIHPSQKIPRNMRLKWSIVNTCICTVHYYTSFYNTVKYYIYIHIYVCVCVCVCVCVYSICRCTFRCTTVNQ